MPSVGEGTENVDLRPQCHKDKTCQKHHFLYSIIYNNANSDDAHVLFPFSVTYLDRVSFEDNNINQQKRKRRNIPLELYFKKIYKRNAEATCSSISFIVFLQNSSKANPFNKLPFLTITKSSRTCNKRM